MAYGDFKCLAKRTASDKVLRDKAFNIARNTTYDRYQRGHASMVYKFFNKIYKFFNKKTSVGVVATLANKSVTDNKVKQNQQLAKENLKKESLFFI